MWLGDVEYSRGAFQCAPLFTRLYLYQPASATRM